MAALERTSSITNANTGSGALTCNVGDLVMVVALNTGSSTTPLVPTGYSDFSTAMTGQDSTDGFAMRGFFKYAASTSETIPSISNCTSLVAVSYGNVASSNPVTNILGQANTGASVSWSGVVSYPNPGSAWVGTLVVANTTNGSFALHPPTSCSLVAEYQAGGGTDDIAFYDSNAPLSSYSFNSKTMANSTHWITKTFVINPGSSGGGGGGGATQGPLELGLLGIG